MFFCCNIFATPLLMAQYKLSGIVKDSDNKEPLKMRLFILQI
jgi:Zn-dependent peptidase ImmA (M78 family)